MKLVYKKQFYINHAIDLYWCKIISDQEKRPHKVLSERINVKYFFEISKLGLKISINS